jgi:predicted house-cleaning noncanonical NTP pyrophosphatase (MazG superfamily)
MKLVRDYIPQIIEESGRTCTYHVSTRDEYEMWLFEKMKEEMQEFIDSPSYEEAADIYEVFRSFCGLYQLELDGVESVATDKRERRGGFSQRIILDSVDSPDTVPTVEP